MASGFKNPSFKHWATGSIEFRETVSLVNIVGFGGSTEDIFLAITLEHVDRRSSNGTTSANFYAFDPIIGLNLGFTFGSNFQVILKRSRSGMSH